MNVSVERKIIVTQYLESDEAEILHAALNNYRKSKAFDPIHTDKVHGMLESMDDIPRRIHNLLARGDQPIE